MPDKKPIPPWNKEVTHARDPNNWKKVLGYIEELIDYKIKKALKK